MSAKYKIPRINWKKTLNPSGLVDLYHSEKCYAQGGGRSVYSAFMARDEPCICSVKPKMQKALNIVWLTTNKKSPWYGSKIEYKEEQAILTHESGAVLTLNLRALEG